MDPDVQDAVRASHFRDLPSDVLDELFVGSVRTRIAAGSVAHRALEDDQYLELVITGVVRVFVTAPDGRTMTIRYCPGVKWYSVPLPFRRALRSTSPARSSWRRRLVRSEEDMSGTPRCMSLKRRLPTSASSRITSGVHRSVSTSAACATGQNWP